MLGRSRLERYLFCCRRPKKESNLCGCFLFFRIQGNRTLRGSECQENVPVVRFLAKRRAAGPHPVGSPRAAAQPPSPLPLHQAEPGSPLPLRSVLIRSPLGSRTAIRVLRSAFFFLLKARDWSGIYSVAAIQLDETAHSAERGACSGCLLFVLVQYGLPPASQSSSIQITGFILAQHGPHGGEHCQEAGRAADEV